ncbi:Reverse transcriptase RNA-dependent DNA polymerase [Macrophomina phaseolina MS6]|uniref:Reverse transcriptase RNA-dependent DNA polymerase n=1 Tax=Macrophomina phaseolina (strain MS6) TaxID=1126212 RepID=K2QHK5_MACPH|nr:Reverse transcriptase RNA-dependent DNA polymerase [Macrophomina phaseolina MS6]
MKIKDGLVLLLLRALYGLKQSPALWQKHLSTTLQNLGLTEVPEAPCLFTNEHLVLFFFVDDIVVIYHKDQTAHVDELQRKLFEIYEMRYLGEIQWFLAIRIIRNRNERKLWLCQDSYISKLTAKFNVKEDSKRSVPLPPDEPITQNPEQATEQDIYVYQQKVGSINYAAVHTRPDIAHAASRLSEHLQNPSAQHLHLAQRVLEYLSNTRNYALTFSGFTQSTKDLFIASSDASLASDIDTRKSIQCFLFRLFGGAIDWKAAKQRTVTTSSTEAELLALSATAKETIWWENLFKAIYFSTGHQTKIQCDNTQTIRLLDKETYRLITKLRHVQIHSHWLRQEVQEGNISISWTPTAETIADGLTKPLNKQKHQYFLQQIGLEDITTKLQDN